MHRTRLSVLQNARTSPSGPHQSSFFCSEGGRDCFSFSALFLSSMMRVYKYLLHRTLNLVDVPFFLIFTHLASLRRAICRNDRISVICFGMAPSAAREMRAGASADSRPTTRTK